MFFLNLNIFKTGAVDHTVRDCHHHRTSETVWWSYTYIIPSRTTLSLEGIPYSLKKFPISFISALMQIDSEKIIFFVRHILTVLRVNFLLSSWIKPFELNEQIAVAHFWISVQGNAKRIRPKHHLSKNVENGYFPLIFGLKL